MRRLLKFALPLLLVPAALFGTSTVANAAVVTDCNTTNGIQTCQVYEPISTGSCSTLVTQAAAGSAFVQEWPLDYAGTVYDCRFWLERDVNNTGWYNESGYLILSPGNEYFSQNYYDGPGYQARVCFQYLWSGTSDPGAVHCSSAIGGL